MASTVWEFNACASQRLSTYLCFFHPCFSSPDLFPNSFSASLLFVYSHKWKIQFFWWFSLCILEEADEDDDPEYNFLDDLDEPDLEDYRNDRAVRITSGFLYEL